MKRTPKDLLHPKKKQPKLAKQIVDQMKLMHWLNAKAFDITADLTKDINKLADKAAALVKEILDCKGHPIAVYDPNDPICWELSPMAALTFQTMLKLINSRINDRLYGTLMDKAGEPSDALLATGDKSK